MKKILVFTTVLFLICININSASAVDITVESSVISNKEMKLQLNKIKTKRIIIANALLLNDEQRKKANEIYSKITEKEAMQLAQLQSERAVLKNMTKENSNAAARKAQRKVVYELQDAITLNEDNADAEFKKILTREQKTKFKRLRKEIKISDI